MSDIFKGRVLVGHALKHDLKVLFLDHPRKMIRDTSKYKPFRNAFGGKTPSLKNLTERMLGIKVQEGEHSSVQDAQAAVGLYMMAKKEWEREIKLKRLQVIEKATANSKKKTFAKDPLPVNSEMHSTSLKIGAPKYIDSDSDE